MSTHKTVTILLIALALTITGLALSNTTYAATGYREVGHFGPEGTGSAGPGFVEPARVAVDNDLSSPSSGDVYVVDSGSYASNTVSKFTATGQPISVLPLPEGSRPGAVAVDPKTGDVYVTNGHELISPTESLYKFTPTGELVTGFEMTGVPSGQASLIGVTVDSSDGDVYIANGYGFVDQLSPSGVFISQISNEIRAAPGGFEPSDVAVDSTGNVYVVDGANDPRGVDKFTFGEGIWKFDGVVDQGRFTSNSIAVNPVSNDLYSDVVDLENNSASEGIEWYDSSEKLLYQFGESGVARYQTGVAVNSAAGTAYLSNDSSRRVAIFEPVQLTPPSASSQPASSVLAESVVFNGSVNPNGLETNYHIDYWPVSDPEHVHLANVDAGNGFEAKTFTQVISGLVPNTAYRAELVATNSEGTTTSEEQSFTTQALAAPEASTGGASEITPYSASIAGTLNPNGIETTYHFDLGADTNYGAQIYGSGIFAGATPITQTLQNLQPGTTYHYRFVASNQAGTVYGADQTFTTTAIPQAISPPAALPFVAYSNIAFPEEVKPATKKPATRCKKGFVKKKGKCVRKPKAKGKKKVKGK